MKTCMNCGHAIELIGEKGSYTYEHKENGCDIHELDRCCIVQVDRKCKECGLTPIKQNCGCWRPVPSD